MIAWIFIIALSFYLTSVWGSIFFFRVTNDEARTGKIIISITGGVCIITALFFLGKINHIDTLNFILSIILFFGAHALFWCSYMTCYQENFDFAFSSRPPKILVTSGTFRFIRHPFYSSYILGWLGTAVVVNSTIIFIIAVIMFCIYWIAARKEENIILTSAFRSEYNIYCGNTGMFIPKFPIKFT